MRLRATWFVTLPIVLVGIGAAHALANALMGAPAGEVFSDAASGRRALPSLAAILTALVVSALGARAVGYGTQAKVASRTFALLPPTGFVLLELTEALSEGRSPGTMFDRPFVAGLLLQAPVAAAGYLLARALLRLSDEVRALLAPAPVPIRLTRRPLLRPQLGSLRTQLAVEAIRGRGPPPAFARAG